MFHKCNGVTVFFFFFIFTFLIENVLCSQNSLSPFIDNQIKTTQTVDTSDIETNYTIEYLGDESLNTEGSNNNLNKSEKESKPKILVKKYRVKRGDTLWDIAVRFLGDGKRFYELVQLNKNKYPSLLKNPNLIYENWELELPNDAQNPNFDDIQEISYSNSEEGTVEVDTYLNVRTAPWGKIIGKLQNNDQIIILGEKGDWYKIDYNGQIAYVHSNYVNTAKKKAGTTPVKYPSHPTTRILEEYTSQRHISVGSGRFGAAPCVPMPSYVSSEFGPRNLFGGTFHYGIDLPVPNGTRINALGDGVVTAVGYEPGGGTFVKIRYDNGLESFYCHLKSYSVRVGERVYMGQEVARSDNTGAYTTGPHLHMEIRRNGKRINPRLIPNLPLPPQ